jgi:acetyl esterase/lipase
MALFTWPPQYSFMQYLRLKISATLLRAMVSIPNRIKWNRDEALIPDNIQRELVKIPSRDPERQILVKIYYPPGYTSSSPAPVLINWHGSGFVLPLFGSDALFCSRVAQEAGIVVVDADYRKGPETPFPGAVNDIEDTFQWVAAQEGLDSNNVAVSGFSAGACLALVAATVLRTKQTLLDIQAVISIYPVTDLSKAPEEKKVPHPIDPLPLWGLHLFNECYVPDPAIRKSPLVSPSFAEVTDFPPITAILTCEGDILWPESAQLAKKLQRQKNQSQGVVLHLLKGVPHAFDKGAEEGTVEWTRREEAYTLAIKLLKTAFDQ